MGNVIQEVFECPKISKEGSIFVEKMFAANQTSDAATYLLLNVLNDENFGEAI